MKLIKVILVIISSFYLLAAQAAETTAIAVMTFNIENGGTQVDFSKVIEAIKKSKADIVGIQEAWGNTQRIASALGWKYYDPRQHVISRFPLLDASSSEGKYVFVEVKPGKVVAIANVHLPDDHYGPDLVRSGASVEVVEANERKVRLSYMMPVINKMSALAKLHVPVFITGDFNSPSNLDWINTTNHRYVVSWPITQTLAINGLTDSYRVIHAHPAKMSGSTWPAGRPIVHNTSDNYNPSANDASDRIDFIFSANVKVMASQVVGEPGVKNIDIAISPWPSDHRAVVSRFEVVPVAPPGKNITQVVSGSPETVKQPVINLSKPVVKQGEPFAVKWEHAPGNGYDYITVVSLASKSKVDPARFYTNATVRGSIRLDATNAAGNWPAWNKANGAWPLKPGAYAVKLMSDDSNKVLASTKLTIVK